MYDRQTKSYWSQILGQAVRGPLAGEKLDRFQLTWTNWSNIKAKYEKANVLSKKTGFNRDYTRDPYGSYYSNQSDNYYTNENLYFDVLSKDDSLNRKDIVIAGEYKGQHFVVEKEFVVREKEISKILNIIFPYPTLSEILKDTVSSYYSDKIFNKTVRKILKFLFNYQGD